MATLKRRITVRKRHRNHAEKLLNDIDQNLDDRVKIKSLVNSLTIVIRNGKIVWKVVWIECYLRLNLSYQRY